MRNYTGRPTTSPNYILDSMSNEAEIHMTSLVGDLDDLLDGTTYKKLLATDIAAGHIKLTSAVTSAGKWYDVAGVSIDATNGIIIYGSSTAFRTRATYGGTDQCYIGSDGAIYAAAGDVKIDSTGITIKGDSIYFYDASPAIRGYVEGVSGALAIRSWAGSDLLVDSGNNLLLSTATNLILPSDNDYSFGNISHYWADIWVEQIHAPTFLELIAGANENFYFTRTTSNGHVYPSSAGLQDLGYATLYWGAVHCTSVVDYSPAKMEGVDYLKAINSIRYKPDGKIDALTAPPNVGRPAQHPGEHDGIELGHLILALVESVKILSSRLDSLEAHNG